MTATRTTLIVGGTLAQRLGSVVLLPLLIATMSAQEFVRFGLFTSLVAVVVPLTTFNLHLAIGRLHFDYADRKTRSEVLLTTLMTAIGFLFIVGIATIFVLGVGQIDDPLTDGATWVQALILWACLALVLMQTGSILARVEDHPMIFAGVSIAAGAGLLIGYVVISRVVADLFLAVVLAYIAAQMLGFAVAATLLFRNLSHGRFDVSLIRPAFGYAGGTMIFVVSVWVIAQAGRWVGGEILTASDAASYTLVSYGTVLLGVFVNAYTEARRIALFKCFSSARYTEGVAILRASNLRNLFIVIGAYVIGCGLYFCQEYILPADYRIELIWLVPAFVYSATAVLFNAGFWILSGLSNTTALAILTALSAIFYIVLVDALKHWGVDGLLWASAGAMAVQSVAVFVAAILSLRRHQRKETGSV